VLVSSNPPPSTIHPRLLLRSRLVLPLSRPPIEDGAVRVAGDRIARVGRWRDLAAEGRGDVVDLGESVLLPGLVNAHCHLDYTDMAGMVPPQKSFIDWIKLITSAKGEWSDEEFAASWRRGADMLLRSGTTTVGDFEALPELLPAAWSATPLRVISFLELTGVKGRRNPRALLQEALARIRTLPPGRCRACLGPHAPYSTVPELLRLAAAAARRRRWPLSVHVAESLQEFNMFLRGDGEMHAWLRRNERDMSDCGQGSPVAQLNRNRVLAANLLAVHVNYLDAGDAALLARRGVSVVHCPRSHAYFGHQPFPFRELSRAGVNLCLGTDSLATVYKTRRDTVELNLFDEMRAFATAHPRVGPKPLVSMVTRNAARALGLAGQVGVLTRGAWADLISVPFAGRAADAYGAVLEHRGAVSATMINGQWAIAPNV
jgi:aminodeoxyfutalosine deaminase